MYHSIHGGGEHEGDAAIVGKDSLVAHIMVVVGEELCRVVIFPRLDQD